MGFVVWVLVTLFVICKISTHFLTTRSEILTDPISHQHLSDFSQGRGIGRQQSLLLAKKGATVIILDISVPLLEEAKHFIENLVPNAKIHIFQCDVSDQPQVAALAEKIQSTIGKVDILINNAGIVIGKSLLDIKESEIEKTIKVNVLAHFWTIKQFLPAMVKENKGHIVTIGSQAGIVGAPKMTEYCASKFAVFGMNECLRRELRKMKCTGVKTTVICPGHINTGLFDGFQVSKLVSLLNPTETEENVGRIIIEAIENGTEQVFIPKSFKSVFLSRYLFSASTLDWLYSLVGGEEVMDGFTGRK